MDRIWIIKESKEKLGTFRCKHILFLHAFRGADTTSCIYGFGKAALIKKIKSNNTQQMFLRQCNLLQQISKMLESKLCVYFTMEIQMNLLTYWDTKDFVRRLPPAWLMFSLVFSHPLLLHQNFLASGYLTRFVNGKAVSCYQMNGVGRKLIWAGRQFQQMCPQHQKNFSRSTVVVKDVVARSMVWIALWHVVIAKAQHDKMYVFLMYRMMKRRLNKVWR